MKKLNEFLDWLHYRFVQFRVFAVGLSAFFIYWTAELINFLITQPEKFEHMALATAYGSTMALVGGTVVWVLKHMAGEWKDDKKEDKKDG